MDFAPARELVRDLGLTASALPQISGPRPAPGLASPLAVTDGALASVAACLAAGAELAVARTGRYPAMDVTTAHVAAAVRAEAWLRDPAGRPLAGFAPLSRLWPAADGWVRTHANYPWHRRALLEALGVPDRDDDEGVVECVGRAISERSALDVEAGAYAAGGLAVAARTADEWRASDPGRHAGTGSVVTVEPLGAAKPLPGAARLPASGVRVLDLTRVIAGPVGTRMLGALGADVLRIDDPRRPELPLSAVDGVVGKASAALDLDTDGGLAALDDLLLRADVVVTGYRPGSLRRFGLDPDQLAARHPGTIVVTLSAWGTSGPWAGRRGFDSLVQVASGIGWASSTDGARPGRLPCQLLDHATGYLLAAGTLIALAHRARAGRASHVRLSLARTAAWLLDQGARDDLPGTAPADATAYRVPFGDGWSGISPPGSIDGVPLTWPHLPPRYAGAAPSWG
ncbi:MULTISPECIES: CoA transferase [unclassified Pseudactinotalea]|uniref:CoA transferase n=1 Tax=unclassified Pseudactinotalea TaxID=2649176 RepID=UPI00128CE60B|nr:MULTISPECIES: CoA transferase [unclassified Pseudactinotalea]MPV51248.1 carnitine dehydratase [Pseudactinotalea sp. HY160]QGH69668.1 carnitine dehydratase [Pseudactinotalea sp. HY158]